MTEDKNVLIRVKDLKKYFPVSKTTPFEEQQYVRANDGITLSIYSGETVGLVGESGCGKSTFGRTLLQIYPQTEGATYYYGRELAEIYPKYARQTIRNLKKDTAAFNANRDVRHKCRAALAAASTEAQKEKAQKELDRVEKKIDEYFDTSVKIFGALTLCDNLDTVSEVMGHWFTVRSKLLRARRKAETQAALKNSSSHSQLEKLNAEIEKYSAQLDLIQKELDELKDAVRNHRKYDQRESRLDTGIDLSRLTAEEMRQLRPDLQIIFQDPYSSLNPRMTIGQLIGEALVTHGMFEQGSQELTDYIVDIMERCGLQGYFIHRYPHEFSGGQRQRVGIARALALQPKFVVCDEAVSALDVSIQSQVINLLRDLREEQGFTYLFISHDLGVVKYISDRIGVMYLGTLVEMAETDNIFANPCHPYTKALLAAIPSTDPNKRSELASLEGDVPSPVHPPKGCKFHTRCSECMGICQQETPIWQEIEPGHFVACHLFDTQERCDDEKNQKK